MTSKLLMNAHGVNRGSVVLNIIIKCEHVYIYQPD